MYTHICYKKIFYFFSSLSVRINGKNIDFINKKNLKSDFYNKTKKIFNIDDTEVNKILVSKKEQHGKYNSSKCFTGHNDNGVIRP